MRQAGKRANGFSMIELLLAALVFTIVAGSIFSILLSSQLRYQGDSGLTTAFQQANLAIDQIARDIHSAGFPPAGSFDSTTANNSPQLFAVAFPWSPNYPNTPCVMGACASPGDYDLVLEAQPAGSNQVQWIRYALDGTTLKRGVAPKVAWADPQSQITIDQMSPYLENVVNQSTSTRIFTYFPKPGTSLTYPSDIYEVTVCLKVQPTKPDPQSGRFRTITVTGQAVRFNPNQ
jgi:Tfp pilus assembly protein PilW